MSERELTVDEGRRRWSVGAERDPFEREDADFVEAVRGGPCRIRAPYDEALKTHRLACAAAGKAGHG
ncbi:hypothetical protein AAH991_06345 [Microbispora sp. ZYX-F-249]|uniref:Uncharacterized protein n=1 Tax=Microbispora maris TaxID=3144104 RepID=A0ABV0AH99_9ACTN